MVYKYLKYLKKTMNTKLLYILLIMLFLPADTFLKDTQIIKPNILEKKLYGKNYYIHLPDNYDKKRRYKLAIGLHGVGGDAYEFVALFGDSTRKNNLILVSPQNYVLSPIYHQSSFYYGNEFILKLIQVIKKQYLVEETVFLFGFSLGAHQGIYSALKNPKLFPIVACLSGGYPLLNQEQLYNAGFVKLLYINGDRGVEKQVNSAISAMINKLMIYGAKTIDRMLFEGLDHTITLEESAMVFEWYEKINKKLLSKSNITKINHKLKSKPVNNPKSKTISKNKKNNNQQKKSIPNQNNKTDSIKSFDPKQDKKSDKNHLKKNSTTIPNKDKQIMKSPTKPEKTPPPKSLK